MEQKLLHKMFRGKATDSELTQIRRWVNESEENKEAFHHERAFFDALQFNDLSKDICARKRSVSLWKWAGSIVAAVIALVLLYSVPVYFEKDLPEEVAFNTIKVPAGQRVEVTLADGTKVWLNSQSKLIYPTSFSDKARSIRLEGEAFFEVVHNPHSPFIVHSPLLAIKVLGTKFNVKAYLNEKSIVTLAEGIVEVETNDLGDKLTLKPNEQVSYAENSGLILKKNINANMVKVWMNGEGAFVQQKLDDIVRDLERKFNVKISLVDPSLGAEVFTCRFKDTATIQQVLSLLKETRRLDYSFDGEQIRIFKPVK